MRLLPGRSDHGGDGALKRNPHPSDADIDREMTNICRCGTYAEIRNGIRKASALMAKG